MGSRLSNPKIQYSDDAGNPLPEGKLYFYDSGTTNFRTTYADSGLSIANSNPVLLDGAGRVPSIFLEGNYRAILTDKDDNQIWELDPVTGTSGSAQFSDWLITTTYVLNDIVRGSDGKYYISITNSNLGNDPTSSTVNWSEMVFITMWNANQTYNTNETVTYSGVFYSSLIDNNTANQPDTSPTEWALSSGAGSKVSKSGDTMTGDLEIVKAIDELTGYKAVNSIGGLAIESLATTGNVRLSQTDAAGAIEKTILNASRNAGLTLSYNGVTKLATISSGAVATGQMKVTDAAPVSGQDLTRKDYVDGTTSKIANGYMILPSGIIVQWGATNATAPSSNVTLPITFPTAFFSVIATPSIDSTKTFGASIASTSNFTMHLSSGTRLTYWIALGH